MQVLPGGEGVLPHADGGAVVDGVAELGQRHVQLVHRGQVLAGLPVTLEPGLLKLKLLWHLVSFLFVYDLNPKILIEILGLKTMQMDMLKARAQYITDKVQHFIDH